MAYLSGQGNMMLDLLQQIDINILLYKPDAGWFVFTNIPDDLIGTSMTVKIDRPYLDNDGSWKYTTSKVTMDAPFFVHEIVDNIVAYIETINEEAGYYFEDHCYLEQIILDTETMEATTFFGS